MKRKRDYENQLIHMPDDMIAEILTWIPFAFSNWLNFRLTCKRFLRLSKRFQDPSVKQNRALCWVSKRGYTAAAKELLDDRRVDPSARDCKPARNAARNGHIKILEMILSHPKYVPIPEGDYALLCSLCASSDDWGFVQTMLKEKKYKYKQRQQLLMIASANGKAKIAQGILKNSYWNKKDLVCGIRIARGAGHEGVVRVLINDRRYDGSDMGEVFGWACEKGHLELFHTMLSKYDNKKLSESIVETNAKIIMFEYGRNPTIVVWLLKALLSKTGLNLFDCAMIAILDDRKDIARALLRDPQCTFPKGYEAREQEWLRKIT